MKKIGLMMAALVLAGCQSMPQAQVKVQDGVLVGPTA